MPVYINTKETSNFLDEVQYIDFANAALLDAFGRQRISNPITLFDSKQILDGTGIFYDDVAFSGAGTSSTYSKDRASRTLGVSNVTAGHRIRQTKQRFNYQPGKSQLIFMTGVWGNADAGITKRVGYFDESNGLGLKIDETGPSFFVRSNVTGTPVDVEIPINQWDIPDLHPTLRPNAIDFTKSQIFFIDFEWLGVGSIRFGFVIDGKVVTYYQVNNANILDAVYMSTPNLPLRYELENDGTGPAAILETICSSVISEGGQQDTGITRYISNGATHVDANSAGTTYALVGIRLASTNLDSVIKVSKISTLCAANPNFEWTLKLNPSVAGTFTYGPLATSAIEFALGTTANTVTGGTNLAGGYVASQEGAADLQDNLYYLGSTIAGTSDTIVLCATPLSNNADILGGITIREYA